MITPSTVHFRIYSNKRRPRISGALEKTPHLGQKGLIISAAAQIRRLFEEISITKKPLQSNSKTALDGSNDDAIHCFKEGQRCSTDRVMLHTQLDIWREPDANTFECTDSNVEEAYPSALKLVDSGQEGDSEMKVEWRHHW